MKHNDITTTVEGVNQIPGPWLNCFIAFCLEKPFMCPVIHSVNQIPGPSENQIPGPAKLWGGASRKNSFNNVGASRKNGRKNHLKGSVKSRIPFSAICSCSDVLGHISPSVDHQLYGEKWNVRGVSTKAIWWVFRERKSTHCFLLEWNLIVLAQEEVWT